VVGEPRVLVPTQLEAPHLLQPCVLSGPHELLGNEGLELGRVRPRLRGSFDQLGGDRGIALVVVADLGDHAHALGRVDRADPHQASSPTCRCSTAVASRIANPRRW
jgi:hypothetical protein